MRPRYHVGSARVAAVRERHHLPVLRQRFGSTRRKCAAASSPPVSEVSADAPFGDRSESSRNSNSRWSGTRDDGESQTAHPRPSVIADERRPSLAAQAHA